MNVFGIGKTGLSRAIVNFAEPPPSHPHTVCFHFPNKVLSHSYVLKSLEEQLQRLPNCRLVSLMFQDRNVLLGCLGLENRWIIKCKNEETCEALLRRGVMVCNKRVTIQYYDEILDQEYKEYMTYLKHRQHLFAIKSQKKDISKAGRQEAIESLLGKGDGGAPTDEAAKEEAGEEEKSEITDRVSPIRE